MIKLSAYALVGLVLLATIAPTASGFFTPIYAGGGSEPDLFPGAINGGNGKSILDVLYGAGNYTRVADSEDQIWFNPNGSARATAKYAGWTQNFGFIKGTDGSDFTALFQVTASGYNPTTLPMGNLPYGHGWYAFDHIHTESYFRFGNTPSGAGLWSSRMSDNGLPAGNPDPTSDHMVTWKITGNTGQGFGGNVLGNYVLAWEDQPIGLPSDRDYNDLVVEVTGVTLVPEPTTLAFLGLASSTVGLALLRRRRRSPAAGSTSRRAPEIPAVG